MRISSSQFYASGLNAILEQQKKVTQQRDQIETGKKVNTAEDDPIAASRILDFNQEILSIEQLKKNNGLAQGNLELSDSIMDTTHSVIQRIRELHIEANNDTFNAKDREALSKEFSSCLKELVDLANSQDVNGNYLFSGYQNKTPAYTLNAAQKYEYQGDQGEREIEITHGKWISMTHSADQIFGNILSGNGFFEVSPNTGTNTGKLIIGETHSLDNAPLTESYHLQFVTNSAGDLAYTITGSTSGQIVPALPLVIPNDAPKFDSKQSIEFAGVSISSTGTPAVGDDFLIQASEKKTVFDTVSDIVTSMQFSYATPSEKADQHTLMGQYLSELDQALDQISSVRTEIGVRLQTIDLADSINEENFLQTSQKLSDFQDLDYVSAISLLENQTFTLEAAQKAFSRLMNLSLFNYLK